MNPDARTLDDAADGVSFDFGHVLVGLDLDELAARLRPHATDLVAVRAAFPKAYAAHDAIVADGQGHEAGWRALMRVLVTSAATLPDPDATVDALWRAQPTKNLWRHVPATARTVLEALAARDIPMVITSNSEGHLGALVDELGLTRFFRRVLDSGALGISKPDPRMFALAAKTLDVSLARMVHVGDSEAADIVGARDAGALAIRFDGFVEGARHRPTRAHLRVDDHPTLLQEILRLTGRSA